MNSRKIVCTVQSVKWDHDEANVGDSIGVEAKVRFRALSNRSNREAMVEETFKIDFEISEYSGIPPHRGGGFRRVEVATISEDVKVALRAGTEIVKTVEASWVVLASEETSPDGGLPEFCVRALYKNVGPQSKLMKIGDIVDLCWIRKGKEATPLNPKKAEFWFENDQKVVLRAESHLLKGFSVDFTIFDDKDGTKDNETVAQIRNVQLINGVAEAEWFLDEEMLREHSFGNFKFDIVVHHASSSKEFVPSKRRSGNIRHTATAKLFFALYYVVKDQAFKKAAQTQWREFRKRNNDARCIALIKGVRSETRFKQEWKNINAYLSSYPKGSKVVEGHVLTHASKGSRQDGLEFDPGTFDRNEVRSLPLLKWGSNATLILHGCNTAVDVLRNWSPAEEFATRQKVPVLGQDGFAYFSGADEKYVKVPKMDRHSGDVFLWAYRRMRNEWTGDGTKMQGRIFTP